MAEAIKFRLASRVISAEVSPCRMAPETWFRLSYLWKYITVSFVVLVVPGMASITVPFSYFFWASHGSMTIIHILTTTTTTIGRSTGKM
jgi:hypothetical protein